MASGVVTYVSGMMFPHREIYNGASAQTWPMKVESGSFPSTPFKVTKAVVKFDIRNVYKSKGTDRHMLITRDGGAELGDVPTTKSGVQEQALLTAPDYRNITSIKTDGVEWWACQLRGGSYIRIVVNWEETQPEGTTVAKEPVIVTGIESTGEKGYVLHTEVGVSFDGVDISKPINENLLSMSYTDNEEDEADDLQIKLEDHAKLWLGQWLNDTMQAAAYGIKTGGVDTSKYAKIASGFLTSTEFKAKGKSNEQIVDICYQLLLNRGPDAGGKASYVNALKSGKSVDSIVSSFCSSNEFKNKSHPGNKEFITSCYKLVLDREPDTAGMNYWLGIAGSTGTKGLTISAGVKQFKSDGKIVSADFGFFELDQLKASGPPSNIQIKGTSLPYTNGIRTEERDKSWEGYTLKRIGEEIATNGGLGFLYDCPTDPSYSRVEQAKQTDIAFLMQLCHDNGFSLKISGLRMIIFDQARYESMKAVTTIKWLDGTYTKYNLDTQDGDTHYDQCTVIYYDATTGTKYEATANADDYDAEAKEHTVCTVTNRKVGSAAEAAELASKILRLHNKYERKCDFTLLGNPMLGAGLTVTLEGFGLWDDKYIIKTCKHEIGSNGYTTKITLRTIPEGKVTVVKVEEEKSSSGNGTQKKQQQTNKAWYTTSIVKVYQNKDGNDPLGKTTMMNKDVEVKVLGNMNGDRVLVQYGDIRGYVDKTQLEKRTKTKKKDGK